VTSPIDIAYVDIVAREKSLDKLRKDIDKTLGKVDKDVVSHLRKIDDEFDDAFTKIDRHFADTAKSIDASFKDIADSVEQTFDDIDDDVDRHQRRTRSRFATLGTALGDIMNDIGQKIRRAFRNIFEIAGDVLSQVVNGLGRVGGVIGGFVASSPLLALILALVPAIIALAAALSQLIGLVGILPSGLGVLVAAIVPAVVAFQNFGEAVSALAEGDIDKINAALEKLSPSARLVTREVAGLLPLLKQFQRGVQEAFFAQARGSFSLLASVLPRISENFNLVAATLGRLFSQFAQFATSINVVNALNDVFNTTANIISKLSGPIIRFFDAIAVLTSAGLPFVERLVSALGRALDTFSAFINRSIESGAFNEFVEDAIRTVKELIDLVKALGRLLGTIFAGTEESGHDFIKTLTDLTVRIDKFFQSAEGQDVLRDLTFLVKVLGAALDATVTAFIFLDQQFRLSLAVLEKVGRGFFKLIEVIGNFFGQIPAKINELGGFLATIPALIGQGISTVIDTAFTFIGTQVGLLLFTIQVLPGKIVEFFASLPARLRDALASTGPSLLDIFKRALDDAQMFITVKFNEIVAFVRSVPDRLVALGPIFLQAGKNLITSFMNGFRSVGSFIGDVAGDIVRSVKSFLNRAIDKINSGIAAIDAVLPGNLARIPHLASGAVVGHRPGGTLAVVGEGREDEIVSPISTLEDIIRKFFGGESGTGGMTVNFGPGSISISFASTPTEGEARTVGAAVADGIVDRLASRNVRTQLRTV
jgi:phage-related protein